MYNNVQTLWIGDSLSPIERMCLSSFVKINGGITLYTYSDVKGIPDGVEVKDGNTILDESEIFTYSVGEGKGSVSAFSNIFRYKLLYELGGWWVDTDVLCLNPLPKDDKFIFSTEYQMDMTPHTATGIIKCEPNSRIMKECFDFSMKQDKGTLKWGEIGPKLLHRKVKELGMEEYLVETVEYNPLKGTEVSKLFDPHVNLNYELTSKTVHLWNEIWRRFGVDKNAQYHPESFIEKNKRRFI